MQQFKIKPAGFKEIRKQLLIRASPIMLVAVSAGIIISIVNIKDPESAINVMPVVIPLIALAGFGLYRGVARQTELMESYLLTLTSNLVTREQLNTPEISIYFNEIVEIVKNENGSFLIRGKDSTDLIGIPAQVEDYDRLEERLNQISPVKTKEPERFLEKYVMVFVLFTLGLMVCVFTVTNKVIVALSGVVLVVIMLWSFYEISKSKNLDAKAKQSRWWLLVVLASVIGAVTMKLIGFQEP